MVKDNKEYTPFEGGRTSPGQGSPARRTGGKELREPAIAMEGPEGREPQGGGGRHRQPADLPQGKIGSGFMVTPGGQPPLEAESEGEG
ncbi:MAG: hypothetical protein IMW96_07630 [Thermoanaerobacteraceae bacterium]|uniref:hypothetical protein n=1 Tax=Thermanaeromonas sp. C210 TaxID=2731925 RepID=UPI00155C191B|nr:hypothetical protein [Thermanaeromonas sp. C210]MBE3581483.1 hypothetical protein [Thermoanaerobacteraceae bacterium]GFN22427.1 hypothetical protein TAMC210_07430 [Thermanaeromonas sp. C210]